ncbi:MAG: response regulator [Rhodospirillales bacterium]|jgi:CheY-like chemotaxis protein|nr:response regulator [Rhodospirillales bacterium]
MASAAATTYEDRDAAPKWVILIVEDEVIIRSVVSEYLRDCGFAVIEAANAAEAVAVLSTQTNIHLVFSDITMPGSMDGFGLARWIHEKRAEIPILLTSGAAAVLNASGPFTQEQFIRKPYLLDEIEDQIRSLLARA